MNIANLKKAEIVRRHYFKCKHHHTGLEHPRCYDEKMGIVERIGYFDIETFSWGFSANMGIALTYVIIDENEKLIVNSVTAKEIKKDPFNADKRLMKELCEDLRKFDRIVTFYGKRFDVPFVRTRSRFFKWDFPEFGELHHTDVYDIIKRKFSFSRRNMGAVCDFFGIVAKSLKFKFRYLIGAIAGNKIDMKHIIEHNIEDVVSTRLLYHKVRNDTRLIKSSI
jgi:uncharacterized protein YprB with RNaseH-like and TPR domain